LKNSIRQKLSEKLFLSKLPMFLPTFC